MPRNRPLDPELRKVLAERITGMTVQDAREALGGLSPDAIGRAVGGFPVSRGTELQIRAALGQIAVHPTEHAP